MIAKLTEIFHTHVQRMRRSNFDTSCKEILNEENPKFQASNFVVQTATEFVAMKTTFKPK
jgi:hypothetical protein